MGIERNFNETKFLCVWVCVNTVQQERDICGSGFWYWWGFALQKCLLNSDVVAQWNYSFTSQRMTFYFAEQSVVARFYVIPSALFSFCLDWLNFLGCRLITSCGQPSLSAAPECRQQRNKAVWFAYSSRWCCGRPLRRCFRRQGKQPREQEKKRHRLGKGA